MLQITILHPHGKQKMGSPGKNCDRNTEFNWIHLFPFGSIFFETNIAIWNNQLLINDLAQYLFCSFFSSLSLSFSVGCFVIFPIYFRFLKIFGSLDRYQNVLFINIQIIKTMQTYKKHKKFQAMADVHYKLRHASYSNNSRLASTIFWFVSVRAYLYYLLFEGRVQTEFIVIL